MKLCHLLQVSLSKINFFVTGSFPSDLKLVYIRPLQKPSLDKEDPKNFRPVANLKGKMIEHIASSHIMSVIAEHDLSVPFHQLAELIIVLKQPYCMSIRTFCTKWTVVKYICVTTLALLDISAAFGTVNHNILLHRLKTDIGVSGAALRWCESTYGTDHMCACWKLFFISCCFELFCASRISIGATMVCYFHFIQRYNLQHHVCTDDTQRTSSDLNENQPKHQNRNFLKTFCNHLWWKLYTTFIKPHTWYPNNKVKWIVTIKAKNRNKWTKTMIKTEGYMVNQLTTTLVQVTALVLVIYT